MGKGIDSPVATMFFFDPKTKQLTWTHSWSGMYEHGGEAFGFAALVAIDAISVPVEKALDVADWGAQKTGVAQFFGFKPGETKEVLGLTALLLSAQPQTAMVGMGLRANIPRITFLGKYFRRVKNFLSKIKLSTKRTLNTLRGKLKGKFQGLGDATTSPWLLDLRIGVRMHIEKFRKGASYVLTRKQYELFIEGKKFVGDPSGQFITTKAAMDKIFKTAKGDISKIEKALGHEKGHFAKGGGLVRVDINNPLLHNVRFPSGLERGANPNFRWGGYTKGGSPEAIIDVVPNTSKYVDIIFIE
jgi:hypothetical protein